MSVRASFGSARPCYWQMETVTPLQLPRRFVAWASSTGVLSSLHIACALTTGAVACSSANDGPVDPSLSGAGQPAAVGSSGSSGAANGGASGAPVIGTGGADAGNGAGGAAAGSSGAAGENAGSGPAGGASTAGGNSAGGSSEAGNSAGGSSEAGNGAGGAGGGAPPLAVCPGCKSVFDGTTLAGWVQLPANSWTVTNGAMHSLGTARGVAYTTAMFGDFRFIFQSRLVQDPAKHLPCVLFWGDALTKDALQAIQVQPPNGYMWDYRATGPTANKSPDQFESRFNHPAVSDATWNQCEMLGNQATGTMRFACCQMTGDAPCKASEIVDFKDPTAGKKAPLALQVHNAGMIEEFKALYVESPVAQPSTLLTTQ